MCCCGCCWSWPGCWRMPDPPADPMLPTPTWPDWLLENWPCWARGGLALGAVFGSLFFFVKMAMTDAGKLLLFRGVRWRSDVGAVVGR